ncbi:hypothetical protein [Bacteroides sp.]|uniref:hypothetical protein n=1 Tax=Bacteroides sp. TaxID=29523 RepID=UPI0026259B72|nr:hypothetical protein [Bacteroides sp.]
MSTTFYQQIISFLCLFIASGAVTAQNSDVLFFNEVDTTFQKVRVGQEVEVGYYSTYEIENLSAPQWKSCGAEQLSGPHDTSSSRTSVVNGKMEKITLKGINYKVRFETSGWVTLPMAIATIKGKEVVCTPMKLYVQPAEDARKIEGIVCSFSTDPVAVQPGKIFKLELVCNHRPDQSMPQLEHPGIRMLSSTFSFSRKNGKEEYRFIYALKIVESGSYVIKLKNLTFGGVNYLLEPYLLKIEGETYI